MTQPTAGFGLLIPSAPEASCTARDMPRWAWVGGVSVVIVPFGDCTQPFVSTVTAASPGLGSIASMNSVAPSVMALARASPISFDQTGPLNHFAYHGQGRMVEGVSNRSVWFFYDTSQKFCLIVNN